MGGGNIKFNTDFKIILLAFNVLPGFAFIYLAAQAIYYQRNFRIIWPDAFSAA